MPTHAVFYVRDDGECITKLVQRITPDRLKASCPPGSRYVVRQAPRTKQWEVYDLRRYQNAKQHGQYGQFYKAPPPTVTSPHKDAAIGYAILM